MREMHYKWKRVIVHVDMDAFFASVEQVRHPHLTGKAVVVQSNPKSRTVIAASYEARQYGAKVGLSAPSHPAIHICYADLTYYRKISDIIMQSLQKLCPQIEVYSIDEAYLDFSGMHYIYPSEDMIIQAISNSVFNATGLKCSIGMAENKPLAKLASQENKPNGVCIVPPNTEKQFLYNRPISELCGIGPRIEKFLNQHHVYLCQDMQNIPISTLSSRFGQAGREIWHMCQGQGSHLLQTPHQVPKSMGNSKCIAPKYYTHQEILALFDILTHKLCRRLRAQNLFAQQFNYYIVTKDNYIKHRIHTVQSTHYQKDLKQHYQKMIASLPQKLFIRRLAIRTPHIYTHQQRDLIEAQSIYYEDIIDAVQEKFGDEYLQFAKALRY